MESQQRFVAALVREVTNLSDDQLRQATEIQKETKEPLPQILVNMGLINEKDKAKCLGKQWGIPFADLTERQVDKELVKQLPRHLLQRLRAVPLEQTGRKLTVAMVNPLDIFAIDQLRLVAGLEIEPVIASDDDINNALSQAQAVSEEIGAAIKQVAEELQGDAGDITI